MFGPNLGIAAPKWHRTITKTEQRKYHGFARLEIILLLAAIGVPTGFGIFIYAEHRARFTAQRNACISNLGFLQRGKAHWALENKKADSDFITLYDIYRTLGANIAPTCPANGNYTVTTVGEQPVCSLANAGHTL